ncbi:MAG: hypothetical protein ACE10D_08320 [Planctomycetota bacterium]
MRRPVPLFLLLALTACAKVDPDEVLERRKAALALPDKPPLTFKQAMDLISKADLEELIRETASGKRDTDAALGDGLRVANILERTQLETAGRHRKQDPQAFDALFLKGLRQSRDMARAAAAGDEALTRRRADELETSCVECHTTHRLE